MTSASPGSMRAPNNCATRPARRSASTRHTFRCSVSAMASAMFATLIDLPARGCAEVKSSVRGSSFGLIARRLVRNPRYCSACRPCGSLNTTRRESMPASTDSASASGSPTRGRDLGVRATWSGERPLRAWPLLP